MCPNCKRNSKCGCDSCKSRNKGKISRLRAYKFVRGDFIKCPYCRQTNHSDAWLDEAYKEINELI